MIRQLMHFDVLLESLARSHRKLSITELRAFIFMAKAHMEEEPITCAYLATILRLPRQTMATTIKTLEDAHLITKRRDPKDPRAKLLELTAKGLDLVNRAQPRTSTNEQRTAA